MNENIPEILKAHWQEKKGEENFPAIYDISENDLAEIWQNCFIIRIEGAKFVYEYCGESIIDAYSFNMENDEVTDDALYPESPDMPHKLIEAINAKDPVTYDGALINKENADIKFRKILLPLGENGRATHVIGAMIWRPF